MKIFSSCLFFSLRQSGSQWRCSNMCLFEKAEPIDTKTQNNRSKQILNDDIFSLIVVFVSWRTTTNGIFSSTNCISDKFSSSTIESMKRNRKISTNFVSFELVRRVDFWGFLSLIYLNFFIDFTEWCQTQNIFRPDTNQKKCFRQSRSAVNSIYFPNIKLNESKVDENETAETIRKMKSCHTNQQFIIRLAFSSTPATHFIILHHQWNLFSM